MKFCSCSTDLVIVAGTSDCQRCGYPLQTPLKNRSGAITSGANNAHVSPLCVVLLPPTRP